MTSVRVGDRGVRVSANVDLEKPDYCVLHPHTRSEIAIRFQFQGKPIGVLNLESFLESAFGDEDVGLLKLLARFAVVAIRNAEQEKRFWGIAQKVVEGTESSRGTLKKILLHMRDGFGFDAGLIFLADYERRVLKCDAWIGCHELRRSPEDFTYSF